MSFPPGKRRRLEQTPSASVAAANLLLVQRRAVRQLVQPPPTQRSLPSLTHVSGPTIVQHHLSTSHSPPASSHRSDTGQALSLTKQHSTISFTVPCRNKSKKIQRRYRQYCPLHDLKPILLQEMDTLSLPSTTALEDTFPCQGGHCRVALQGDRHGSLNRTWLGELNTVNLPTSPQQDVSQRVYLEIVITPNTTQRQQDDDVAEESLETRVRIPCRLVGSAGGSSSFDKYTQVSAENRIGAHCHEFRFPFRLPWSGSRAELRIDNAEQKAIYTVFDSRRLFQKKAKFDCRVVMLDHSFNLELWFDRAPAPSTYSLKVNFHSPGLANPHTVHMKRTVPPSSSSSVSSSALLQPLSANISTPSSSSSSTAAILAPLPMLSLPCLPSSHAQQNTVQQLQAKVQSLENTVEELQSEMKEFRRLLSTSRDEQDAAKERKQGLECLAVAASQKGKEHPSPLQPTSQPTAKPAPTLELESQPKQPKQPIPAPEATPSEELVETVHQAAVAQQPTIGTSTPSAPPPTLSPKQQQQLSQCRLDMTKLVVEQEGLTIGQLKRNLKFGRKIFQLALDGLLQEQKVKQEGEKEDGDARSITPG